MNFQHRRILETRAEPDGGAPDDPVALATRAVGELREAVETRATALETRQAEDIRALTARVEAAEVRAQRPNQGGGAAVVTVEQRAFTSYIRRGAERIPAEEARALRVADDTVGGYLAPDQFSAEIIRNLVQFSPVRAAARVGSMSAANIRIPSGCRTSRRNGSARSSSGRRRSPPMGRWTSRRTSWPATSTCRTSSSRTRPSTSRAS